MKYLIELIPFILTLCVLILFLCSMYWLILGKNIQLENERKLPRQLLMLALTLIAVIIVIFSLPVAEATRNQIVALLGLAISGLVAFSSTTIVANFMAGIMIRINKPFNIGDYIKVGEYFGRVSERGLLDTEIQSEKRELISIPNKFLISNPIIVTSTSGAIVSVSLSLGYEIHHSTVKSLLLQAAERTGLIDPYVQITQLGNHSVTFLISGVLEDINTMLTTKSILHSKILDVLHDNCIEIVSPTFVNQRKLNNQLRILAKPIKTTKNDHSVTHEKIVFDKAEQAKQNEHKTTIVKKEIETLEEELKNEINSQKKADLEELINKKIIEIKETEDAMNKSNTYP